MADEYNKVQCKHSLKYYLSLSLTFWLETVPDRNKIWYVNVFVIGHGLQNNCKR